MRILIKKIMLFISGLVMALGSSLSTMEGGADLTISDLGSIPLMAWLFAIGAGIAGFLGNPNPQNKYSNNNRD